MRYLLTIAILIAVTSCGSDSSTESTTPTSDSTAKADSLKKVQTEEEVSEELIHGAFNELNRDALGR